MKSKITIQQLRAFGRVMGIAFIIIGLLLFGRGKPECLLLWVIGVLFYATGIIRPEWLEAFYSVWMKLALVLSWVNTRILLGIIFYCVLAPISIAMRLFRFDPLDRAINKHKSSYWLDRPKKAFVKSDYERLY